MFKVTGENTLTGNTWDCVADIATSEDAHNVRNEWQRLEFDYKIKYYVEKY